MSGDTRRKENETGQLIEELRPLNTAKAYRQFACSHKFAITKQHALVQLVSIASL
jgi:hypothetical protein